MTRNHSGAVIKPPLLYLAAFAFGILLHLVRPLPLMGVVWQHHAVGWPLLAAGVALAGWAVREFRQAGEDPNVHVPTAVLVTSGPYAHSRNPMYIALSLLYVGIGVILNAGWVLAALPAVVVVMHFGVVRREEAYLERRFGDEYLAYRARVRRWL